MAQFVSKFDLGDRVYIIQRYSKKTYRTCATCQGNKKIVINDESFICPKCYGDGYFIEYGLTKFNIVNDLPYKIEKISIEIYNNPQKNRITYMLEETGVGSGNVYDELYLFETKELAEQVCKELDSKENVELVS